MIDRDILLVLAGGAIGALSSLFTIFAIYWLDGMRLKRQWQREDQLQMRDKRDEIKDILANAMQQKPAEEETGETTNEQGDV